MSTASWTCTVPPGYPICAFCSVATMSTHTEVYSASVGNIYISVISISVFISISPRGNWSRWPLKVSSNLNHWWFDHTFQALRSAPSRWEWIAFHDKFETKVSITKNRKENIFSNISGFLLLLSRGCIEVGNAWCVCSAGMSMPTSAYLLGLVG